MVKNYFTLFCIIVIVNCFSMRAQQDAQYTQYMYNTIVVNPAYAGSRGVFSGTLMHRSQWTGIEGAPETQTLSINSPIGTGSRVGLGLSIINDKIGPVNEISSNVDFSYTIPASENGKLSFGLKAGIYLLNVNFDQLEQPESGDTSFTSDIENNVSPTLGAGIYYHSENFYIGASVPSLLETKHYDTPTATSSNLTASERRTFYFISGVTFDLTYNIKAKPAIIARYTSGAPSQIDFSANFKFYERLTLGVSYRFDAAISALFGYQISDGLMMGMAYDYDTSGLGRIGSTQGSYEAFLRIELFKKVKRVLTPRFF